ncbi:MAG: alpha/beta hydrolase [Lachnospiraceae bacterium]|nr:alpha/beta hydrolase [Lachnospiraceae bacterium]
MMNKLAVVFPGIGYTVDKPLLHCSRRLASSLGYEVRLLPYTGFPKKVIGDRNRMEESYQIALEQSVRMLSDTDLTQYEDILLIGKSIGTIVAARLASESPARDRIGLVLYTPLQDTFLFPFRDAIAFTGSSDPWTRAQTPIPQLCAERDIPCLVIPQANHSLESDDVLQDVKNLGIIMEKTREYMLGRLRK